MTIRTLLALVLIATTAGCVKHSVLAETHATTHRLVINDNASCSGTAIGPHLLLSASHCFGEPITGEGADVSKVTVDGTPVKVTKFVQDGKDHIILVVDEKFKAWADLEPREPKKAEKLFIWGNPSSSVDFYREGHVAGYSDGSVGRVTVVDLNVWFGDSGSAIFDSYGDVIGVTSMLTFEQSPNGVPLKFMAFFPFAFTESQYEEVGYGSDVL